MDPVRFDTLTKDLSIGGTRRRLVRLLAALPLGVTLTNLLGDGPEATAEDDDHGSSHRRHRRKAKHRHQTGNNKENRKGERTGCTTKSRAKTCAGKCGTVRNTCGKRVDCGRCTCATGCPQCQTCNPATGQCVNVANGTACDDGNACTQTDTCQDGVCQGSNPVVCNAPGVCETTPGTCDPVTGACAYPDKCPSEQDCLSNNTCAIPCTCTPNCSPGSCPGGCGCGATLEGSYCSRFLVAGTCGCTAGSCDEGQICSAITTSICSTGFGCFIACTS